MLRIRIGFYQRGRSASFQDLLAQCEQFFACSPSLYRIQGAGQHIYPPAHLRFAILYRLSPHR